MLEIEEEALAAFWEDLVPRNFVDGSWKASARERSVANPSTGVDYASVPDSSREEVEEAISAAERAGRAWSSLTLGDRVDALMALSPRLEAWGERLLLLESVDSGNPLSATRRDVELGCRYLRQWPAQVLARPGAFRQPYTDGISITTRVPFGVVGKIIAYNHPSLFAIGGMIFPLLAGNTMVIKASEQTPVATLALGRVVGEALPPGVVNFVSGSAEAGDTLAVSPRVKRIAFTGSCRTALRIQSRLSESGLVKSFSAELGGKNSIIVFPDADLDGAVEAVIKGASLMISQGQSCQATARVLVHESLAAIVEERVCDRLAGVRVGPSYDPSSDMGPLVSAAHRERVRGIVEDAVREGARLVCGGTYPVADGAAGFYMDPTIIADVPHTARVTSEEVFGPVITIETFTTEEEAIDLANQTEMGLSAAVWTGSAERALRVPLALEAGYIWVNDSNRHYFGSPFGGLKASGTGREESIEEYDSFTELRSVNIRVAGLGGASDVGVQ